MSACLFYFLLIVLYWLSTIGLAPLLHIINLSSSTQAFYSNHLNVALPIQLNQLAGFRDIPLGQLEICFLFWPYQVRYTHTPTHLLVPGEEISLHRRRQHVANLNILRFKFQCSSIFLLILPLSSSISANAGINAAPLVDSTVIDIVIKNCFFKAIYLFLL